MPGVTASAWQGRRQPVRGRPRKWLSFTVHLISKPTWEGAHYKDGQRAWDFLKALDQHLNPKEA